MQSYKFVEQIAIQLTANNLYPRIVEEALKDAKATKDDLLEAYALTNRGEYLHYDGFCKESNENYEKALLIYEKNNIPFEIARIYLYIGTNFHDLEKYDDALNYYDKSIEYAQKSQNWHVMTTAIGNSAVAHRVRNNLPKAIEMIKKAIEIDEKYGLLDRKSTHLMRYADMLLLKKEFGQAKTLLEESIQLAKDLGFAYGIVTGLAMFGILMQEQKNYRSAISYVLESLDLAKKHSMRSTYMDCLSVLGGLYIRNEEYDKALAAFEECLPFVQGKNMKLALANNYYSRAFLNERLIQLDQALDLYQKALEIFSDAKIEIMKNACSEGIKAINKIKTDTSALYNSYYNITYYYRKREQYEKALESLNQALKIAENLNDKAKLSSVYNFIGIIYSDKGDNQMAISYIKKASDYAHEIKDIKNEALYCSNIAKNYKYLSDFENATNNFEESIKLYESIKEFKEAIRILKDAGDMEFALGRYQNAENYYLHGYELAKTQDDKENLYSLMRKIAGAYRESKELDKANEFYSKALDLAKGMNNIQNIGISLSDLALLAQTQKNYAKSISLYEEAWDYMKSSSSATSKAVILDSLADNYFNLNDFKKAFERSDSALKIFEELKDYYNIGENHIRKNKYYTKLFDIAKDENNKADMEKYRNKILEECNLALDAFSKLREKNHVGDILEIIGDKYKKFGEFDTALEYYKRGLEIFDRLKLTKDVNSLKEKIASIKK